MNDKLYALQVKVTGAPGNLYEATHAIASLENVAHGLALASDPREAIEKFSEHLIQYHWLPTSNARCQESDLFYVSEIPELKNMLDITRRTGVSSAIRFS